MCQVTLLDSEDMAGKNPAPGDHSPVRESQVLCSPAAGSLCLPARPPACSSLRHSLLCLQWPPPLLLPSPLSSGCRNELALSGFPGLCCRVRSAPPLSCRVGAQPLQEVPEFKPYLRPAGQVCLESASPPWSATEAGSSNPALTGSTASSLVSHALPPLSWETHSSLLAWRTPWTEEPGGLQAIRSQSRTRLK